MRSSSLKPPKTPSIITHSDIYYYKSWLIFWFVWILFHHNNEFLRKTKDFSDSVNLNIAVSFSFGLMFANYFEFFPSFLWFDWNLPIILVWFFWFDVVITLTNPMLIPTTNRQMNYWTSVQRTKCSRKRWKQLSMTFRTCRKKNSRQHNYTLMYIASKEWKNEKSFSNRNR